MTIKVKDFEEMRQQRRDFLKNNGVTCIPLYGVEHSKPVDCTNVTISSKPLPIQGSFDFMIAKQIAEKQGVCLTKYDFGRGEDEVDEHYVFSIDCQNKEEMAHAPDLINVARSEFIEKVDSIIKTLLK